MKAETRLFGTIEIEDDKIITLEHGMIGFPDYTHFSLIFDKEKEKTTIMWFQCMDDGQVAFPVIVPTTIKEDYAPKVSDEMVAPLGELTAENTYILSTVTVPREVEKFTMNLKAPIIINTDTQKGVQIIVEDDYPIKYPIYEALKARKERVGE